MVLWENIDGETVTHHMGYAKGQLLVEEDGYYYLYSKVTIHADKPRLLIQHKVMKDTSSYDNSIELMRSKRLVGVTAPYFLPLSDHMCSQTLT